MDTLDFSDFFKTKLEANDFSASLSAISEKIYQTDFNVETALLQEIGMKKKERFMLFVRNNNLHIDSNTALKSLLDTIQEKIAAMPVVSLTVAFEPDEHTLQALSQWFVVNNSIQVLLDITVDRKLIAGAALTYKGKYLDFSIRTTFERIYNETNH